MGGGARLSGTRLQNSQQKDDLGPVQGTEGVQDGSLTHCLIPPPNGGQWSALSTGHVLHGGWGGDTARVERREKSVAPAGSRTFL